MHDMTGFSVYFPTLIKSIYLFTCLRYIIISTGQLKMLCLFVDTNIKAVYQKNVVIFVIYETCNGKIGVLI